uniref:VWFA domain-containing protein n=1 Tax=Rhabditophanes sp. KR3021 TaxID=114890 RepID=A0AC35U1K4_9BILA
MKLLYFFILLAGLVEQASAVCKCTSFSKPTIRSQYDYSVLVYPRDDVTEMPCNPVRCVYTIQTTKLSGINGNVYYLRNFQKSRATLKFYNGNDLSADPYFKFDENSPNSELTITPLSDASFVTIVLDVNPALLQHFPTFIFYATGFNATQKIRPSTTTTTQIPSVSTTQFSQTTLPTQPPIAVSNVAVAENYNFEADLALILDINSSNFTKLSDIAQHLINSITITPIGDSQNARVNLILYDKGNLYPHGWTLNQKTLNLIAANLNKTFDNDLNVTNTISLAHLVSDIFEESKLTRPNVQRVALFVTDNQDIQVKSNFNNETFASSNFFEKNDIHPVFLNFNDQIDATNGYTLANIQFTGTHSNLIVLHNYIDNADLFKNVLLNGNVLCNAEHYSNSIQTDGFNKRYCNNMHVVTYCDRIDLTKPISINFKQVETHQDSISIFDDKDVMQNSISGSKIGNFIVYVQDSAFIKVIFATNSSNVYKIPRFSYSNCVRRS